MKDEPFRFKVDKAYDDLGAVVELSDHHGMMFDTADGRAAFFQRAEKDPRNVPYGASLSHARATNLGVWGSTDMLYADCVKIMALELERLAFERGLTFHVTEEELSHSREFRQAFEIVRLPKDAAVNNLVRSLGTNQERLPYQAVRIDEKTIHGFADLHRRVVLELCGDGKRYRPY